MANKLNKSRKKNIIIFLMGILFCALVITAILSLPIFQANTPIKFYFIEQTTVDHPYNSEIMPTLVNTGIESVRFTSAIPGSSEGITVRDYSGTVSVEITIPSHANGYEPSQSVRINIPQVSLLDSINNKIYYVTFVWDYSTQQWQLTEQGF